MCNYGVYCSKFLYIPHFIKKVNILTFFNEGYIKYSISILCLQVGYYWNILNKFNYNYWVNGLILKKNTLIGYYHILTFKK